MGTFKNINPTTGETTNDITSPYTFSSSELATVVSNYKTSIQSASLVSVSYFYARMELNASNSGFTGGKASGVGKISLDFGAAKLTRTDSTGLAAKRIELGILLNPSTITSESVSFGGKSQVDMVSNVQTFTYTSFRSGGSFEIVSLSESPTTAEEVYDAATVLVTIPVDDLNTNADLAGLSVEQTEYWFQPYGIMRLAGSFNGHTYKIAITDATFLDNWEKDEARWIGVRFKPADVPTETTYQSAVPASRTNPDAGALTKDVARIFFISAVTAYAS
jgi:hypothetical protein